MRRKVRECLLLSLMLCVSVCVMSQQATVEVVSFSKNELSQAAKLSDVRDEQGMLCGLIRIKSTLVDDLQFTFGKNGQDRAIQVQRDKANAMVYLYVAPRTRYINVVSSTSKFNTYQYLLPESVESEMVYEMELVVKGSADEIVIKKVVQTENFLVVTCNTPNAELILDHSATVYAISDGNLQLSLPFGSYHYVMRDRTGMYHIEQGTFDIMPSDMTHLDVQLSPAFGSLELRTVPESGASVFINGEIKGTTPLTISQIKSGVVKFAVQMSDYKTEEDTVRIVDNKETLLQVTMHPIYASLLVTCEDKEADIYINNVFKGKGTWKGRLSEGNYLIEGRKENHVNSFLQYKAQAEVDEVIRLSAPIARTGMLSVTSNVPDALVSVDGKEQGVTPSYVMALVGKRQVNVSKSGYNPVSQMVDVEEGLTKSIRFDLTEQTGVDVSIKSDEDCDIYIDGEMRGLGRWSGRLADGHYRVSIENSVTHERLEKQLTVNGSLASNGGTILEMPYWGHVSFSLPDVMASCEVSGGEYRVVKNSESVLQLLIQPNVKTNVVLSNQGNTVWKGSVTLLPGEEKNYIVGSSEVSAPAKVEKGKSGFQSLLSKYYGAQGTDDLSWVSLGLDYAYPDNILFDVSFLTFRCKMFYFNWSNMKIKYNLNNYIYCPSMGVLVPFGKSVCLIPYLQVGFMMDFSEGDTFSLTTLLEKDNDVNIYGGVGLMLRFHLIKNFPIDIRAQYSTHYLFMVGISVGFNK